MLSILKTLFKGACLLAAILMGFYWIFEFVVTDEDLSLVDYKKFHQTEVRLPEVSLCIENPFMEDKLYEINSTITVSKYLEFLKGNIYEESMRDIDYDNVTVDLSDHLLHSTVGWNNGSFLTYTLKNDTVNKGTYTTYNGFLHNKFVKCFASKLNNDYKGSFNWFEILYEQNPFLNGFTGSEGRGLIVVLHYPKQFLVSTNNVKFFSKSRDKSSADVSFIMSLFLKDMEILHRRNKRVQPCLLESNAYDEVIYERHFESIGCRATYQKTNTGSVPICTTKEDMKKAMALSSISHVYKEHPPPCQIMSRLNFDYEEFDMAQVLENDYGNLYFGLQYHIPDQFKLIKHSRSITIQAVFGYIGGYVAILLGMYINDHHIEHICIYIYNFYLKKRITI